LSWEEVFCKRTTKRMPCQGMVISEDQKHQLSSNRNPIVRFLKKKKKNEEEEEESILF
jgi:hypothetical protein